MLEVFEKKPYVTIPTSSTLQELIQESLPLWRGFCALPDGFKEKLRLDRFNTDWADPGYRNKKANPGDKKELYHYLLANPNYMFADGVYRLAYTEAAAIKFFGAADRVLREVIRLVADAHRSVGFDRNVILEQLQFSTLRFLRYVVREQGTEIADAHFDYSGLTSHLYPLNNELEYLSGGVWKKFSVPAGHMPVFPGYQVLTALGGRIDPLTHRAVQEQIGERIAMVVFTPFTFCERFEKGYDQRKWALEHKKGVLFEERLFEKTRQGVA